MRFYYGNNDKLMALYDPIGGLNLNDFLNCIPIFISSLYKDRFLWMLGVYLYHELFII